MSAWVVPDAGTDVLSGPVSGVGAGEPAGFAADAGTGVPSGSPGGVTGGTRSAPVEGVARFEVLPVLSLPYGVCVMRCPVPW